MRILESSYFTIDNPGEPIKCALCGWKASILGIAFGEHLIEDHKMIPEGGMRAFGLQLNFWADYRWQIYQRVI